MNDEVRADRSCFIVRRSYFIVRFTPSGWTRAARLCQNFARQKIQAES
jgi:hypothetical protein